MEKRSIYSEVSIQKFYNHLLLKQKNKVNFEYEIRVDSEQIMPRSKDLSCFYSFKEFITSQTEIIEILLYRGLSRNYEKYVYELSERKTTQIDIDKIVAQELEKYKKEREFIELHKTVEEYKIKNSELKSKIEILEAESKNGASLNDFISIFSQSGLLSKNTDKNTLSEPLIENVLEKENKQQTEKNQKSVLEGFSDEQLICVLNVYKDKLGEVAFQSLLASFMKLGEHPNLIPIVRQLIDEKITKN